FATPRRRHPERVPVTDRLALGPDDDEVNDLGVPLELEGRIVCTTQYAKLYLDTAPRVRRAPRLAHDRRADTGARSLTGGLECVRALCLLHPPQSQHPEDDDACNRYDRLDHFLHLPRHARRHGESWAYKMQERVEKKMGRNCLCFL